jgi:RNA polymerase sigma factor (sigma-70 family)
MADASFGIVLRHLRRLTGDDSLAAISDGQLLRHFAERHDESAFEALLARHGPMVWGLCRRLLPDQHAAEDAFQATFFALARKAGSVRRPDALASFLYGVAYRVASRLRAGAARRRDREGRAAPRPTADPLAELTGRELCGLIDDELNRLPERYRAPLLLCCLEGRTRDEAARQLGTSLGTLKHRLDLGRRLLRTRLARRGVALPAVLVVAALARHSTPAAMPAPLAALTCRAAPAFAGLRPAAGPVSRQAAALANDVLDALALARLKWVAALVLAVGVLTTGVGLAARPASGGRPAASPLASAGTDQEPPRVDALGDPLPPGALARLGTVRFRHGVEARSIAFSPDGALLASAGDDGRVKLWDVASCRQVRECVGHVGWVHAVAFAPDGKRLASAGEDGRVNLWDVPGGKELRRFDHRGRVLALAFAPDGKRLASTGADRAVHVWDVDTGKELAWPTEHKRWVDALAFAPDGKRLATGSHDRTIRLWDASTGRLLREMTGHTDLIRAVAFAPDGTRLASGSDDRTVRLWDVVSGQELHRLAGHNQIVLSVAFAPDGKTVASGSHDWTVRLWDVTTGQELHQEAVQNGAVQCVAFSPDGRTLAATSQAIRVWDVTTWKEVRPLPGHRGWVQSLAFAPDGKALFSGSSDETVVRWDVATAQVVRRFRAHQAWGKSVAFSPDGTRCATGGANGVVRLWDGESGKPLADLAGHASAVLGLAFAPDGRLLASASRDQTVRVWDLVTRQERYRLEGHAAPVSSVVFAPDGRLLATAGEESLVRLWDAATGKAVRQLEGGAALAFSPDGVSLVTGCGDGTLRQWDVASGKEVWQAANAARVDAVAFSPDGRTLAAANHAEPIRLWETATGQERARLTGQGGSVLALAFAPDGRTLASGSSDTTVLLWDLTATGGGPSPAAADVLWRELAAADAAPAYRAQCRLLRAEQAVPFLAEHLRPATTPDPRRLRRLLTDLDDDDFATREQATVELDKLGEAVVPALRAALKGQLSAEVRQRVERVLRKHEGNVRSPQTLQALRAVEVLERLGTPVAREVLARLAQGQPDAVLTRDATAALRRLAARP